jgi:RNA-directed DNA polymerase
MTILKDMGAVSTPQNWHSINWEKVEQEVMKLQVRIAKATKQGRWNKVKSLQWLLTHSFSAKCLAVKRITTNRGKNTPGVDGIVLKGDKQKYHMIQLMNRRKYKPKPLRRIHIPKANGKTRPLGIPTMLDRAWQALHSLALMPVAESRADHYSYGFRPGRSTADAIERIFSSTSRGFDPQWILEGDIKGCFDNISHQWLLKHVVTDRGILQKWLKAGFMEKAKLFPTDKGTPQGGIISPCLSNITLDGLEIVLDREFSSSANICGRIPFHARKLVQQNGVKLCRYADDFIVTGTSRELLEEKVKPVIEAFLRERGLELSQEKTSVTHINKGFDFLGQNVRRYKLRNGGSKLLIKPSKKNVQRFLTGVRTTIKKMATLKQEVLIARLNPMIRGWANYHRHVVSKEVFSKIDYKIWLALWCWSKRRHPNKGRKWISRRYFRQVKGLQRAFSCTALNQDGNKQDFTLFRASTIAIVRHPQILPEANPFAPDHDAYFERRLSNKLHHSYSGRNTLKSLRVIQNGVCPECRNPLPIKGQKGIVNHIRGRLKGGKANITNLALLHKECHEEGHQFGFKYKLPAEAQNASA